MCFNTIWASSWPHVAFLKRESAEEVKTSTPCSTPVSAVTLRRELKINGQIGKGGQRDKLT